MKLSWRIILPWIALIIISLLAYILLKNRFFELKNIFSVPFYFIPLIAILSFLALSIGGIILKKIMNNYNISLNMNEWMGLIFVSKLTNYFLPFGATTKAMYLKKKYNFSFNYFFVMGSVTVVLDFFVYSLVGLISIFFLYIFNGFFNFIVFMIILAIFLVTLAIIVLPIKFKESANKFIDYFIRIVNRWRQLVVNKKLLFSLILLYLLLAVFSALRFKLLFMAYGIDISIFASAFVYALNRATVIIRITPGNLGINEGVIVFAGYLLGIGINESLMVALLDRVISFAIIFIFGSIYTHILINKKDINLKNGL